MKKLTILIPVAPFEPLSIIKKSIESLKLLKSDGLVNELLYLLDCPGDPSPYVSFFNNSGVKYILRSDTKGRRGGAINHGLEAIRKADGTLDADYIALFDVDSRPDPDFLLQCVHALEQDGNSVIASGARYITNRDSGIVPKIIAAEYSFFEDVYRLYERFDGFKQFNGLIGVIDARALDDTRLNEEVYCEDLEFTQRIYLQGKKPVLVDTRVGEQAPTTITALYNQRVRWLSGALEGLAANLSRFPDAPVPLNRKAAWFASMTVPFGAFMLTPFVPLYGLVLRAKGHRQVFFTTTGLMFHVWLISICGAVALINRIGKKKTPWTEISRSDI